MRMSLAVRPPLVSRPRNLACLALGLACLSTAAWNPAARAQNAPADAVIDGLRRAAAGWDRRLGPERQVVDVVCLVPDLATFLEVVGRWDERHYFPVLIDDVEYTIKFLRAFHPAKVVRYPGKAGPVAPSALWDRAVEAVGKAWSADGIAKPPRGDAVPSALGKTPPGVVVSAPGSPSLAGAVALAAGRFQPLVRWETTRSFNDDLEAADAEKLARELEGVVTHSVPRSDELGDDCDFVTLAGNYPFRYLDKGQRQAFDDLILRSPGTLRRWAYAGRLMGGPIVSAYRAMCSLFLNPATAVTYNTYEESKPPWSTYAMDVATARLNRVVPTVHVHGPKAGLAGWHQSFDPLNHFGLALVNTHGGPTTFHLPAGPGGHTSDVPPTEPAAVIMIHSFSAEAPDDPDTIAGRWLANGAFVYFGSMNEPFLQSFRPPAVVATMLAENLPAVAAVRTTVAESFGKPWRLVYFGDPLWRVRKPGTRGPVQRLSSWDTLASWPAYLEYREPATTEPDATRLAWAIKTAIYRLQVGARPRQEADMPGVLLGIDRQRLEPRLQVLYDDLLVDVLRSSGRNAELLDRLAKIPPAERTRDVRRHLETAQTAALARAAAGRDFRQALALWADVRRAPGSRDFVRMFTDRVGQIAGDTARLSAWQEHLSTALRSPADPANTPVIEAELKAVRERLSARPGH